MRYWIYKDTQILGPYAREDLDQAGSLHPETLVCEEDSGSRDSDWRCVSDVPALSGLRVSPAPPLSEGGLPSSPAGAETIGLEALGVPSPASPGDWISGIFEETQTRRLWGQEEPGGSSVRESQELSAAQDRIRALNAQVQALQARLDELAKPKEKEAPAASPSPVALAAPPAKPGVRLGAPKTFQVVSPPPAEPPPAEAPAAPEASSPGPGFAGKGIPFKLGSGFPAKKKEGPAGSPAPGLKFGATKSFPVMPQEPAFLAPQAPPAPAPPIQETPPPEPAAKPAPAISLRPLPRTPVPAPSAEPPLTISFKAPVVEVFPSTPLPPSPAPEAASPELAAAPVLPPAATPPPMAAPETAEVLARLAKPAPPPPTTVEKPRRKPSKAFVAGSLVLLAGLLAAAFLFFRSSRDLKNMVNMGSDQKPLGAESPEEAERPLPPLKPKSAGPPQAQIALPPAPTPSPEPARERPADLSQTAIELVKGYPLDGGRGTVAQWLQYSYTGNSGEDHKEEWTAGAVDATTFVVQYRLLRGGKASREPISYVFDADVSRKTVQGKNALARDLLAGTKAPPRKTRPAKAAHRRAAKPKKPAPAKKPAPQLPLPSDADLLPPPEGDAGFKSDTIQ